MTAAVLEPNPSRGLHSRATTMNACPVCASSDLRPILRRERLPVFQNVVYRSEAEALKSPSVAFLVLACGSWGLSFNGAFDEALAVYDTRYNNDVVSRVFDDYGRSLAATLISRFDLQDGVVFDVGCGSGGSF